MKQIFFSSDFFFGALIGEKEGAHFSLIGIWGAQNSRAQMPVALRYRALSLPALNLPELSSRRPEFRYPDYRTEKNTVFMR